VTDTVNEGLMAPKYTLVGPKKPFRRIILAIVQAILERPGTEIHHVKGHTGKQNDQSQLNRRADKLAKEGLRGTPDIYLKIFPDIPNIHLVTNEPKKVEARLSRLADFLFAENEHPFV